MTQAYVQKTVKFQAVNVTSVTAASITPTAGNQLVATVSAWSQSTGGSTTTPWSMAASDGTNTWTTDVAQDDNTHYARGLIASALNVVGSAVSVTITPTVGGSGTFYCNGNITEFSGTLTASALDSVSAAADIAGSTTSATATLSGNTAQADELLIALLVIDDTTTNAHISTPASSGYTSIGVDHDANNSIGYEASYKVVSSVGTHSAGWTFDSIVDGVVLIAAYKAAAGGAPPTITAQPQNAVAKVGATATFSVSATGTGTLTYQWQSWVSGAWADISGATSSGYTTGTLAAGDSKAYRCNVTDDNGTTASNDASLTVALPQKYWRTPAGNATATLEGRGVPPMGGLSGGRPFEPRQGGAKFTLVSGEFFDAAAGGGTIVCAGIASAEAIGQPTISVQVAAAGVASAQAIGAPVVAAQVAAAGIATAEASGQPAVSVQIAAAGIASAEAIGQPTVGSAAATIDAAGIASAEAHGAPAVSAQVAAAGIASAQAIGQPAIAAQIAATGIATSEAVGAPTISVSVAAAGIASAEATGQPAVSAGIAAVGVASATALGQPAVGAQVAAAAIGSGEAIGAPVLAAGIGAAGIASAEAIGQPTVGGTPANIDAAGIASAEAVGQPTIAAGVSVAGVPTVESFGVPTIATQIIVPGLISAEAIGAPSVTIASFALSAQHAAWLEALARLHGLIDPLTVTSTGRSDGVLVQTFSEVAGVVTVTPVSVPSGAPGASALTAEQADWLEALARVHGLIDPQTVGPAGRTDGTLVQTIVESPPGTVTVTRAP